MLPELIVAVPCSGCVVISALEAEMFVSLAVTLTCVDVSSSRVVVSLAAEEEAGALPPPPPQPESNKRIRM